LAHASLKSRVYNTTLSLVVFVILKEKKTHLPILRSIISKTHKNPYHTIKTQGNTRYLVRKKEVTISYNDYREFVKLPALLAVYR
jgi:hypothetical protein